MKSSAALSLIALGACATGAEWRTAVQPERGRELEQLERARAAKDALAKSLMAELSRELTENGPAAAIDVCARRAPEIARSVSAERGVRIGRTSLRLRNPTNTAPVWARATVAENVAEPRYFSGPSGELGVLLPIQFQSACTACHGKPESIDASVRDALSSRYPQDRATGFAVGDLRGWFWIEVP